MGAVWGECLGTDPSLLEGKDWKRKEEEDESGWNFVGHTFFPLTFYVIFLCLFSNYDNVVLGLKVSAFLSSHLKKRQEMFQQVFGDYG